MGQSKDNTKELKWRQISEPDRYKIEGYLADKKKPAEIAKLLSFHRTAICREIAVGTVRQLTSELVEIFVYKADYAQMRRQEKAANKGRGLKIGRDHEFAAYVEQKIGQEHMSPDAVIGELRAKYPDKFKTRICTKTVYNYIDAGLFLTISNKDLPVKRNGRKNDYHKIRMVALNNRKGESISNRPANINKRDEIGHWEMDLVVGSTKPCLLVMTERKSRSELIFKIPGKEQAGVIAVIDRLEEEYKQEFSRIFKTITMDNGSEFLDFAGVEKSLFSEGKRTKCYYAHPYSSWERGSNENCNKLIRRFIPKGSDISAIEDEEIKRIEHWMNNYPRRIFDYRNANDVYMERIE
jgi:IS30 family transposase